MIDYSIDTNQLGPHEDVLKVAEKHWHSIYQRPVSETQQSIFDKLNQQVMEANRPIILDSGCGTGMSSIHLAELYPDHLIIGIDKSAHRLARATQHNPSNLIFVRAELIDLWRLMLEAQWPVEKHYILYPNPWPKKHDLKKRFHGHPVFPNLIRLSPYLEIRSNWKIYLEEFAAAASLAKPSKVALNLYHSDKPMTLFEKKYAENQQDVFRLELFF